MLYDAGVTPERHSYCGGTVLQWCGSPLVRGPARNRALVDRGAVLQAHAEHLDWVALVHVWEPGIGLGEYAAHFPAVRGLEHDDLYVRPELQLPDSLPGDPQSGTKFGV